MTTATDPPMVLNYFMRRRVVHPSEERSLTKQSFKEECDINVIMDRWQTTGQLPRQKLRTPTFGDFTNAVDFQTALERVRAAELEFAALPAEVRSRCENNPARFIEFCLNEENAEELVKLGLRERPQVDQVEPNAELPPGGESESESGGEAPPGQLSYLTSTGPTDTLHLVDDG